MPVSTYEVIFLRTHLRARINDKIPISIGENECSGIIHSNPGAHALKQTIPPTHLKLNLFTKTALVIITIIATHAFFVIDLKYLHYVGNWNLVNKGIRHIQIRFYKVGNRDWSNRARLNLVFQGWPHIDPAHYLRLIWVNIMRTSIPHTIERDGNPEIGCLA
jgi:hypothetical protein